MSRFQTALLGDLPAFAANPIGFIEDRTIGNPRPVPVRFGPKRSVLVARPSAIRQILLDDRDQFEKGAEQGRLRPLMGEGMITATGPRWHASREATKAGFSSAGLKDGMELAMGCLARETARLARTGGDIMAVHGIMGRLAMRMAAAALFHVSLDDDDTETLYRAGSVAHHRLSETMVRLIDLDAVLPTRENQKFKLAIHDFEKVAGKLAGNPKGVLGMLGPVTKDHGGKVLRDEIITMLVAGFDTTATAACWLAYALASRPDLVDWLRPETDATLSWNWEINPASLREMPRARALVQEVLRLYPSGWWLARTAQNDIVLDGLPIKKGTSAIVCPWALHRQPDLWPDPLKLDPMRFFEKSPPEKFSYIPFGAGPRVCIGQHLAMAELTAITAMLVSAFELEPLSGPMEQLLPIGGVTLGAPPDLAIRLQVRPQLRKVA